MSLHKSNTLESINFSQLNTSKSKAMFSFFKSNRFSQQKQLTPAFYEKPSVQNKRSTSFGYGVKSELTNKYLNTPSPDHYEKSSDFEVSPKKGISIGLGRQNCKNVSIFNPTKYPAPTDYNCKDNKENSASYSIRSKLKLPELFQQKQTPGPGQCKITTKVDKAQLIEQKGISFNSKFKSSKSFKIHDRTSSSVDKVECPSLGPLTYNTVMPSTGKQLLSKKRTQKSFYFDKRPRVTMHVQSKSPGPGAYGLFSEFNR